MVIFHSYVSLPEGKDAENKRTQQLGFIPGFITSESGNRWTLILEDGIPQTVPCKLEHTTNQHVWPL